MVLIDAKSYKGKIIEDEPETTVIVATMQAGISPPTIEKQEIFICVDVSGSMKHSIQALRRTLICLYEFLSENNLYIIKFNSSAEMVWPRNDNLTFFDMIDSEIDAFLSTNISEALSIAFTKRDITKFGWVILLTDGFANKGVAKTAEEFRIFMLNNKPVRTNIITFGFKDEFDVDVLSVIGRYDRIKYNSQIAPTFGNLVGEISSTFGFNTRWNIEGDDILYGAENANNVISSDREIMIVRRCTTIPTIVSFSYTDLDMKDKEIVANVINTRESIPDDVRKRCYMALAVELVKSFNYQLNIPLILGRIRGWVHPCSYDAIQYINRMAEEINDVGYSEAQTDIVVASNIITTQTDYAGNSPLSVRYSGVTRSQRAFRDRFTNISNGMDPK